MPPGYEPESEWHISWKTPIQDTFCEVIFGDKREHRADILGADYTIIEIQQSKIGLDECKERIAFYKAQSGRRVVWLVNITEFWRTRFHISDNPINEKGFYAVHWKPARTWLKYLAATTDTTVYLEFNPSHAKLLHFWIHNKRMYARFVDKSWFFKKYMEAVAKPEYAGFSSLAQAALMPKPRYESEQRSS